jgi:hypothetical protein
MPFRSLPTRPNLDQLKHQAKDLLKAYRAGDAQAAGDFADPIVRASIRMRLGEGHGDTRLREFRNLTPLEWGQRFLLEQRPGKHRESLFVNAAAMRLLGG